MKFLDPDGMAPAHIPVFVPRNPVLNSSCNHILSVVRTETDGQHRRRRCACTVNIYNFHISSWHDFTVGYDSVAWTMDLANQAGNIRTKPSSKSTATCRRNAQSRSTKAVSRCVCAHPNQTHECGPRSGREAEGGSNGSPAHSGADVAAV